MSQDPTPREMGYSFALAQIGVEMVVPTLLGFWIDDWLATTPWITIGDAARVENPVRGASVNFFAESAMAELPYSGIIRA